MTALSKMVRTLLEKWLGSYYEGSRAPSNRIVSQIDMWLATFPEGRKPTVDDWVWFAYRLAAAYYEFGYVRGAEWYERDMDLLEGTDPDEAIRVIDPDGKWKQVAVDLTGKENGQ